MRQVASRELRNSTRSLLDRVAGGERITITVDGRAAAELHPPNRQRRWMARERFIETMSVRQADSGLRRELDDLLGGETTDDLPLP